MRAVVFHRPGDPSVLVAREADDPRPRPNEVVVRVRAAGVNRADVLQRRGLYPAPPGTPSDIPGLECAGTVEELGRDVDGWRRGDRVMALLDGGGYAELARAHAGSLLPVPSGWSWAEAAGAPEACLTAFDALELRARLVPREHVLVHAAGSGVGIAAIQIARALGAKVIGLSRDPGRRERIRTAISIEALDPARQDVAERIVELTSGGPEVIIDLVGAAAWTLNCRVARARARWVIVGLLSGARVQVDLGAILRRRLTVIGTVLRSRGPEEKSDLVRRFSEGMAEHLAAGRIRPIVDRVVPLEHAAEAHRAMEQGEHFGKIVLDVS